MQTLFQKQPTMLELNSDPRFFRDPLALRSLREHLLPALIARRSSERTLRVWNPCCGSGEDAYTLTMLLESLLPQGEEWFVSVVGTDADRELIARARRAVYPLSSLRELEPAEQKQFFTEIESGRFQVKRKYQLDVTFQVHDVLDAQRPPPPPGRFDLVCFWQSGVRRTSEQEAQIAAKIGAALVPDGVSFTPGRLPPRSDRSQRREVTPVVPAPTTDEKPASVPPRDLVVRLKRLSAEGQGQEALRSASELLQRYPEAVELYRIRADLRSAQGQDEAACEDLRQLLFLDPTNMEARFGLGMTLARCGDADGARRALNALLTMPVLDDAATEHLRAVAARQLSLLGEGGSRE